MGGNLSLKHNECIKQYEENSEKILTWINSSEKSEFKDLTIASAYILFISNFQDCFIQLIHETFCCYEDIPWAEKPKLIKQKFIDIINKYRELDIIDFVNKYQHQFHHLFKKIQILPLFRIKS